MNHKKVKKQINKINTFFDNISADDDVSGIEKDLLLSYVRKLYETILDTDKDQKTKPTTSRTSTPKPVAEPKKEVVTEAPVERKPFERAVSTPEPADPAPAKIISKTVSEEPVAVATKAAPAVVKLSEDMESIFNESKGTELSDKLGKSPISDLTKALSINERIFTLKELFDGNHDLFNETLAKVNSLPSYDEAKLYLAGGVATTMQWDSPDKMKKAEVFVKLVQRRFS